MRVVVILKLQPNQNLKENQKRQEEKNTVLSITHSTQWALCLAQFQLCVSIARMNREKASNLKETDENSIHSDTFYRNSFIVLYCVSIQYIYI